MILPIEVHKMPLFCNKGSKKQSPFNEVHFYAL